MQAADDRPFTDAELAELFAPVADRRVVALAVSGGPDSLALLLLAHRWRTSRGAGPEFVVLTVDHRLRPAAAAEAEMVARVSAERGLRHRTLIWGGAKPRSRIEEAAREARYALLGAGAADLGAGDVLTAHHRDDQAETFLLRLGKGSGLAGLAAMRPARELGEGVTLRRPLLGTGKARLAVAVAAAGLTPADDETNRDERFARARLRRAMPLLEAAGIDAAGIARAAERLARADAAIEHQVDVFMRGAASADRFGAARLDRDAYRALPPELRLRALLRLLRAAGGSSWPPPRAERVEALDAALAADAAVGRTLAGSLIRADEGTVLLQRESGRARLPEVLVRPGDSGIWDGRFAFRVDAAPGGLTIGPLAEDRLGLEELSAAAPREAIAALPALRIGSRVVAVPHAGFSAAGVAIAAEVESVVGRRLWR